MKDKDQDRQWSALTCEICNARHVLILQEQISIEHNVQKNKKKQIKEWDCIVCTLSNQYNCYVEQSWGPLVGKKTHVEDLQIVEAWIKNLELWGILMKSITFG